MENLPKNVINKIMFNTSHPVADILKASSIFKALKMNNRGIIEGSPFHCGNQAAYYGWDRKPHRWDITKTFNPNIESHTQSYLLTDEEIKEYNAALFHSSARHWRFENKKSVQAAIFRKYGYHRVLCILPSWTLTRQKQHLEDMKPSESYSDSDSDSDYESGWSYSGEDEGLPD
jgi:hypothetical protein